MPLCPRTVSITNFFADDGSRPAGEKTTVQLCWTKDVLRVATDARDSQVISSLGNCGDNTWEGDSLEVFLAPSKYGMVAKRENGSGRAGPRKSSNEIYAEIEREHPPGWMEVDMSPAGGMWWGVITNGKDGDSYGQRLELLSGKYPGPCIARQSPKIRGMKYKVTKSVGGYSASVDIPWTAFLPDCHGAWGGRAKVDKCGTCGGSCNPPFECACSQFGGPGEYVDKKSAKKVLLVSGL